MLSLMSDNALTSLVSTPNHVLLLLQAGQATQNLPAAKQRLFVLGLQKNWIQTSAQCKKCRECAPLTDQLDSLDRRREPAKAGKEGVCRLRRQPHSSSSSSTCRSRVLQKSCFDSHCIRGVLEEAFVTDDVVLYSEKEVTCLQPSCHILECATSNKALIHAQFLCGPLAQ